MQPFHLLTTHVAGICLSRALLVPGKRRVTTVGNTLLTLPSPHLFRQGCVLFRKRPKFFWKHLTSRLASATGSDGFPSFLSFLVHKFSRGHSGWISHDFLWLTGVPVRKEVSCWEFLSPEGSHKTRLRVMRTSLSTKRRSFSIHVVQREFSREFPSCKMNKDALCEGSCSKRKKKEITRIKKKGMVQSGKSKDER
jgi:hypothetical protein